MSNRGTEERSALMRAPTELPAEFRVDGGGSPH
jgi:hypothetical protein